MRRQPGQFQMRNGSAAWFRNTDPLAHEPFVVAADGRFSTTRSLLRPGARMVDGEVEFLAQCREQMRMIGANAKLASVHRQLNRRGGLTNRYRVHVFPFHGPTGGGTAPRCDVMRVYTSGRRYLSKSNKVFL